MGKAIVLCSGGLDSVVAAHFIKRKKGYQELKIIFFDYGQKSIAQEEKSARKCAKDLGSEFKKISLRYLGEISNSLINKKGRIKKLKKEDLIDTRDESKKWYVPCRNLVFLSYGLAIAEDLFLSKNKKFDIIAGFKNEGLDPFPDQSKEFLSNINKIAKKNCMVKLKVKAPLIEKDKEDIVALGLDLGIDLSRTWSCYLGKKKQCGNCLACMLRKEGFYWAGVKDKTKYLK